MRVSILLSFITFSFWLSAQVSADTGKIETIEQQTAAYLSTIEKNKKSIAASSDKIEKAAEAVEEAKESLAKYEEAFGLAQEKYNEDSSPENLKILELNDNRKAIAIKKVASREKRLNALKEKVNELKQNSSSLEARIEKNASEINRLEQEIEERKAQAVIAAKKISKKKIKVPSVPKVSVKPPKVVTTTKVVEDKSNSAVAPVASDVVENKAVVAQPKATPQPVASPAGGAESFDTSDPVAMAILEIKQYLKGDVSESSKLRRSVGRTQKGEKIDFAHLGGEIYSGEVELVRGRNTISFDDSRFRINIPNEKHRQVHVLYIDNRSENRRLLVMEKSLADKI